MLHDRVLVSTETGEGERKSTGGILIPATAEIGKRLAECGRGWTAGAQC
jgi:chaperonin GroES